MDQPENQWRMQRFAIGMQGVQNAVNPNAILEGKFYVLHTLL